jgi:hypothetical protein
MTADPSTLPRWSYPLVLVLLGIVLFVGAVPFALQLGVGVETALFLSYLFFRSRRGAPREPAPAKVLPLFPGHLLLLLALSLLPSPPPRLVMVWMLVPLLSVLYDLVASRGRLRSRRNLSILTILYCIIWADLFFLIERVIVLGRRIVGSGEIAIGVGFVLAGFLFVFLGVYRHWRTRKV